MDSMTENATVYQRSRVVRHYAGATGLQPAEAAILHRIAPEFRGAAVLDLGVGAGRTTPFLLKFTMNYIGIDLSPEMIRRCRQTYPGESFMVGDACDLSRFATGSFALVLFSFNGLDYIADHAKRLQALREIHRVLKPNGFLVFSAHNRRYQPSRPRLLTAVKRLVYLPRRWRMKAREQHHVDYALINDPAHGYRLLSYYIDIKQQISQLAACRFYAMAAVGLDGHWLHETDYDTTTDAWIYYCCRAGARTRLIVY